MTAPHITPLPTPPSRSQSPDTFSTDADAFLGALPDFQSDANAQADYLDGLADQVTIDAASAEAAAAIAAGAANYMGDYNALTTYQIGESVSYNGRRYVAKTVNTGVTPADGANWFLINDGDVLGPVSATNNGLALFDGTTGKIIKSGLNNGTAGQALISGGAGNAPTWGSVEGGILPFTASGNILDGKPLALRSDGKVEQVTGFTQTEELSTRTTIAVQNAESIHRVGDTNKIVVFYENPADSIYIWARVGEVNGTTITWGTAARAAALDYPSLVCSAYDPVTSQLIVAFNHTSNRNRLSVFALTVSGTSFTVGAPLTLASSGSYYSTMYYDSTFSGVVVITAISSVMRVYTAKPSGTSMTLLNSAGGTRNGPYYSAFNGTTGIVTVQGSNSIYSRQITTNASGAITLSSENLIAGPDAGGDTTPACAVIWNPTTSQYNFLLKRHNRSIVAFSSATWQASLGTNFVALESNVTAGTYGDPQLTYDVSSKKTIADYRWSSDGSIKVRSLAELQPGTLTLGSTIENILRGSYSQDSNTNASLIYVTPSARNLVVGTDGTNMQFRFFRPYVFNTNAYDFIGFSNSAASDGQSVSVVVGGGRTTKLSGLTTDTMYFIAYDGAISTTGLVRAGVAISATSLLVEPKIATSGTPSASTYLRGDGAWATVPQALVLLASGTLSVAASEILVNNLVTTGYSSVIIEFDYLIPSAATSIQFRFVEPGGTAGAGQYYGNKNVGTSSSLGGQSTMNGVDSIQLNNETTSASTSDISAQITVFKPSDTTTTKRPFIFRAYGDTASSVGQHQVGGGYWNQQTFGGFRLFANSGTILAGAKYRVYGVI